MKKKLIYVAAVAAAAFLVLFLWNILASKTKVGFLNYQVINLGQISKANHSSFIDIAEVSKDEFKHLGKYDMLFINAMGLKITEDERALIQKAADKGLPVLSTAVTNPANRIISVDEKTADTLSQYLVNSGRRNYRSMLNYVRKYVDKKKLFVDEPEAVQESPNDMIYHPNLENREDEDCGFNSVETYNAYLKKHDLYREDAPRIIITGQMGEPTELILRLEETGNMVYPIVNLNKFIKGGQVDTVQPAAVIYMAHGRMGDYAIRFLAERNIPMFAPLNVIRLVEDWEADKMGMSGGFLSQSVVTPEIDGAIRPYVLFGHYLDEEGLQQVHAIPERLETFVETVNNYVALKDKPNSEKKVVIYYYKGPGQSALSAAGMEVVPSIYNLLLRLKKEGYTVKNMPSTVKELEQRIQKEGSVFGTYAEGASDHFIKTANPLLVSREEYENWVSRALRPEKYQEVVAAYGEFPGQYMVDDEGNLALPRLDFGNVVLMPQSPAAAGGDSFKIVHGADVAPPHNYIASYLWTQYGFEADCMIHFGTHGSLEFTPRKQVALSHSDWPDRLVGALPHFYIYTIGNVGEGMIAKRRSYAGLQSYLTPPFMESKVRGIYKNLSDAIETYNDGLASENTELDAKNALMVKKYTVQLGIHRELGLDSTLTVPYSEDEILKVENFAEELANEKITGQLYTMGVPYEEERIISTVYAMTVDPIAYSMLALDKLRGKAAADAEKHRTVFTRRYLKPAKSIVEGLLKKSQGADDRFVCSVAGISKEDLEKAHKIKASIDAPKGMMAMMMAAGQEGRSSVPGGKVDKKAMKEQMKKMASMSTADDFTKEEINQAMAVLEVERALKNVYNYRVALKESPEQEFASLINAMNGGYVEPSPGGDPIVNPQTLPTGRNLYSINPEATPSESAWNKGITLAENTIKMYRERHNDSMPRKVSYTLWSGEFIETEGATIAQILYMLGVEPIRDAFGRVSDIRLIPSEKLGRPRIDVVVQTSGQLRDLAASRLFLINRAVEMAAAAKDDVYRNQVSEGIVESEKALLEKGLSPKEAREISTFRVFGAVNGGYGTGIQGMVQSGDRWETEEEIANVYLNNMGAYYGDEDHWETVKEYAFAAALTNTDAVIQPRQSNTWGALSLDHVYEFMGGMNLAVRNVTGKDPDAYLSDYRNRNRVRMQEIKEAVGVESRTTIFNPEYIKEKMKGDATSASTFAEIVQNTYGWNVMKPQAIDDEMWDEIYDVYVEDKFDLGIQEYFKTASPAALQEITAVMMETARKGMWNASEEQLQNISQLHTDLVNEFKPACSGFVCDNAKLQSFISSKVSKEKSAEYRENVRKVREAVVEKDSDGMVMKKEKLQDAAERDTNTLNSVVVISVVVLVILAFIVLIRKRRKKLVD